MAWTWRAALVVTVSLLALSAGADAKKPPLKKACQLATTAQVNTVMGRKLVRTASAPTGCGWQGGPKAQASLEIYGFKTNAVAKQYLASKVQGYSFCVTEPEQFLPGSGLGDEAWLDTCASNIAFRVGKVVGEVTTYTDDVEQGSTADTHRTAALTRKAVTHLRKLSCPPSFCRLR